MSQRNSPQGYDLQNPTYVEANRMGRIAQEQRVVLESRLALVPSLMSIGCQTIFLFFILSVVGLIGIIALISWQIPTPYKMTLVALIVIFLLLILLRSGSKHFRKQNILRSDLENPLVQHADGAVIFGKRGYQVEAGGQILEVPWFARRDKLAPGISYNFYYLPESGMILSIEQLSTLGRHQVQDELNKILAEANKFHAAALPINRSGQLADEQMSRVRSKLIAPLFFIILPLGFFGYQVYSQISKNGTVLFNTGFVIIGLIAIVFGILGVVLFVRTLSDITQRRVIYVEGPGNKDKRVRRDDDGGDRTNYYYVIAGERFEVSRKAYMALIDGLQYRAYFTPKGKTLVNLEALEST